MVYLRKLVMRLLIIALFLGLVSLVALVDRRRLVYKISRNKDRLEYCEYHPSKCLLNFMPQDYEKITKQDEDKLDDNKNLNEKFFRKFKYHFDHVADLYQLRTSNKKLYESIVTQKISEPKVDNLVRPPANEESYTQANATFLALVKTQDLKGIASAVEQIEAKFNGKFHYPWTFVNDRPFTNRFIQKIKSITLSECEFVQIPGHLWRKPDTIDPEKEKEGIEYLKKEKIQYAGKKSYQNMCRFYSGHFYNLPELQKYKYYWRVEPDTNYFSDIDYDVFKFMEDNKKTYGFTINIYDDPRTVRTLWDTTIDFLKENPTYLHENGAYDWLLQDLEHPNHNKMTGGYSTCHFWSNFEIADMDFFRGKAYTEWFKHLDEAGGFYYERWGDAPVHSLGLALFEDKSNIHWFRDIGYMHSPYLNCPNSDNCTSCEPGMFTPYEQDQDQNCMANWIKYSMTNEELSMY